MGRKTLTFKILPSHCGKSSAEVIDELVQQTINKVVKNSQGYEYNQLNKKTS